MEKDLVALFIPSLSAVLLAAEDRKGEPLTEAEVIEIRDGAAVVMTPREVVEQMNASRGYADIDPENCWYDWQMLRRELGREPELDAGARVNYIASDGDAMAAAMQRARETLAEFRDLIDRYGPKGSPLVKMLLTDGEQRAHMWLMVEEVTPDSITGSLFEVPTGFRRYRVGDRLVLKEDYLEDWMVNLDGVLHGGFTIRCQRDQMSAAEQRELDTHIGVHSYA